MTTTQTSHESNNISLVGLGQNQGFIHIPTSLTVVEGETAVFQCQHQTADIIGWRINQSNQLPANFSGNSQSLPDGGNLYMLSTKAMTKNNNTRIQCVAIRYFVASYVSPEAHLHVQGDSIQLRYL